MNWIIIAMFPPLLWGMSNFIDKYLISRYFKNENIGALLIFSSLIGTVLMPFIYFFSDNVLKISISDGSLIVFGGMMYVIGLIPYLYAIYRDESSTVASLFQLIPICNYFLGYVFLGERLTQIQILASLLIIFGAVLISLNIDGKFPKLKMDVFFLMFLSSFLLAISTLVFKFVASENTFWRTTFWEYLGFTISALILLCVKSYRHEFIRVIQQNKTAFIGLNFINEAITILGRILMAFASLLAPLALVWVINGFQPLFVFIIGIFLTIFFPKLGEESLRRRHLAQKIIAILIMFLGAYLLNL